VHRLAPHLSLQRRERWLGEAETEWGKAPDQIEPAVGFAAEA